MAIRKHWVIYDGDCGFCQASVRLIKALDWFEKFQFAPYQAGSRFSRIPDLVLQASPQALHCVAVNGQVTRAAGAVRFIAIRCPLFCMPALLLWLPGAMWLAEQVYRWIARHRSEVSRLFGFNTTCRL